MYVSRCRGALGSVIDVPALIDRFAGEVAVARVFEDFFAPEAKAAILADVAELGLDGVVLAGNSVEHHTRSLSGPELKWSIVAAGVNPNRVAFANLLEQVAMPHADD